MIKLFRDIIVPDTGGPTDPIPQEVREKIISVEMESNLVSRGYALAKEEVDVVRHRIEELEQALDAATGVIKQWHNADEVWDIYFNHAPEMKPIREALAGKKEGEVPQGNISNYDPRSGAGDEIELIKHGSCTGRWGISK